MKRNDERDEDKWFRGTRLDLLKVTRGESAERIETNGARALESNELATVHRVKVHVTRTSDDLVLLPSNLSPPCRVRDRPIININFELSSVSRPASVSTDRSLTNG